MSPFRMGIGAALGRGPAQGGTGGFRESCSWRLGMRGGWMLNKESACSPGQKAAAGGVGR